MPEVVYIREENGTESTQTECSGSRTTLEEQEETASPNLRKSTRAKRTKITAVKKNAMSGQRAQKQQAGPVVRTPVLPLKMAAQPVASGASPHPPVVSANQTAFPFPRKKVIPTRILQT